MPTTSEAVQEFIAEEVTATQLYDSATVAALTTRIDELLNVCQMQQKEIEKLKIQNGSLQEFKTRAVTTAETAIFCIANKAGSGRKYRHNCDLFAIRNLASLLVDSHAKQPLTEIPF